MGRAETVITDAASTMPRVDDQVFRSPLRGRRNSVSGAVEALPRSGSWGGLNEALHAND